MSILSTRNKAVWIWSIPLSILLSIVIGFEGGGSITNAATPTPDPTPIVLPPPSGFPNASLRPEQSYYVLRNASNYRLKFTVNGSTIESLELPPCTHCGSAAQSCSAGTPEHVLLVKPGTIRVDAEVISNTKIVPYTGHWTLKGGWEYGSCFYVASVVAPPIATHILPTPTPTALYVTPAPTPKALPGTPVSQDTPTATSTQSTDCVRRCGEIRVENNTGGKLVISLNGSRRQGRYEIDKLGNHVIKVWAGSYILSVEASCGVKTENINVVPRRPLELTYYCYSQ